MSEHVSPMKTYVVVWIALMVLMGLTVFLSTVPMGHAMNTLVALIIAAIKATLVLLFFMHLLHSPKLVWLTAGVAFIQGWDTTGSGASPNAPVIRSVNLRSGTCPVPYFSVPATSCTIGVRATADFGGVSSSGA